LQKPVKHVSVLHFITLYYTLLHFITLYCPYFPLCFYPTTPYYTLAITLCFMGFCKRL